MKLLIVGDIHWSTYSSIVRGRSKNFSTRLENLIASMQFVEQIADEYKCDEEIFLGDFFDRPNLEPEEISALKEIHWSSNPRIRHFIVGNHESGIATLEYNSTDALSSVRRNNIINEPILYPLDDKTDILFLPYITEDNRKSFVEYVAQRKCNKKLIVASHNDIKGVQMGKFISTTGFEVDEIENNCDLYLNGHLHNGAWITDKILNLGNLTGQNFNEDATKYEHHIAIVDTDTLEVKFIENPYAFNFYKIEINNNFDLNILKQLKNNAVLSIKCVDKYEKDVRELLSNKNVVEYRVILTKDVDTSTSVEVKFECVDHLKQFYDFVVSRDDLENIDIIKEELAEVCK